MRRLSDPVPRSKPQRYTPIQWSVKRRLPLVDGVFPFTQNFAEVLASRRSHGHVTAASLDSIGAALWHSCRTLQTADSHFGFQLERRPVPSAGALHPIHLIVQVPGTGEWGRYDHKSHELELLACTGDVFDRLATRIEEIAGSRCGSGVAFVAEPGRTEAKYIGADTLIWRDAGILQGILSLVFHAHGLRLCLLGSTGEPWSSQLAEQGKLRGVGLGVITAQLST